jgi:hypothetical protein
MVDRRKADPVTHPVARRFLRRSYLMGACYLVLGGSVLWWRPGDGAVRIGVFFLGIVITALGVWTLGFSVLVTARITSRLPPGADMSSVEDFGHKGGPRRRR